jgi:hypothetical protein
MVYNIHGNTYGLHRKWSTHLNGGFADLFLSFTAAKDDNSHIHIYWRGENNRYEFSVKYNGMHVAEHVSMTSNDLATCLTQLGGYFPSSGGDASDAGTKKGGKHQTKHTKKGGKHQTQHRNKRVATKKTKRKHI